MNRKANVLSLIIMIIISFCITIYLLNYKLYTYSIITGAILLIISLSLIIYIRNTKNIETIYESKIKQILKTYDSVLVKCSKFPNIKDKNIIMLEDIEDLIDAQLEIRKPIYYMRQTESCCFLLLDNNEALILILKIKEEIVSPLEIILKEMEVTNKKDDYSILSEIDKTTIVTLQNKKSFRVSPVRNQKNKELEVEIL